MYNILQLVLKYGAHLLFLVLEILCFYLIINYNRTQKEIYLNSSNVYSAKLSSQTNRLNQYLRLHDINDSLMYENASLIENIIQIEYSNLNVPEADSLYERYNLIPSTVCNSTIHLRNNHITLCKGRREGVLPGMGVISSSNGIVGIVRNVSENFAHVMTLLNSQTVISCAVKSRFGHGALVWKVEDPLRMTLESVPKHSKIAIGDTVITSGYSTMFPKGIVVGKIEKFSIPLGSNNYNITVKLINDLTAIDYAYVVQNRFAVEQLSLENEVPNE